MRLSSALALVCAGFLACAPAVAQPLNCGVVLMHGKWGMPQSPYLKPVVQKLEPICQVTLLEMPWSRGRLYDQPYGSALVQIRQAVSAFRQSGAQWVAVGGQSFGANASLAYMAQVGDADAVLAMAPGHVPENFARVPEVRRGIDAAQQRVASDQGDSLLEMTDINQGQRRQVTASAAALWSYFDPQGWGNMALSAHNFRRSVPVFWAIACILRALWPSTKNCLRTRTANTRWCKPTMPQHPKPPAKPCGFGSKPEPVTESCQHPNLRT